MELNLIDRSNYLKGLLILIRKNNVINKYARKFVMNIATALDFNKDFVDSSIKNLSINKNIIEGPLKFSDYRLAKSFVKDGLRLAFSDGNMNLSQIQWLIITAKENNLSEQWFFIELEDFIERCNLNSEMPCEIQKYVS